MSDRFNDKRTYYKRSTGDDDPAAKRLSVQINRNYAAYAKAVKVTDITEDFKQIVNDFRKCFVLPSTARPVGLIKTQWITYYKDHH